MTEQQLAKLLQAISLIGLAPHSSDEEKPADSAQAIMLLALGQCAGIAELALEQVARLSRR